MSYGEWLANQIEGAIKGAAILVCLLIAAAGIVGYACGSM